jgi:hypothetical protein
MTAVHNARFGPANSRWLLPIPQEEWRDQAACSLGYPATWWDADCDGETREQKAARHKLAKSICQGECPVRLECARAVQPSVDEGVRAGYVVLLPLGRNRRAS